jgi:hypothetical protein
MRLGSFDAQGSRGQRLLSELWPDCGITRQSLYSFASLIGALACDVIRRKDLLVKWLTDNFNELQLFLGMFHFELE